MSCGKNTFKTRKAARIALLSCWRKGKRQGFDVRAERGIYWCEECQGFHLTKSKPGDKRGTFA